METGSAGIKGYVYNTSNFPKHTRFIFAPGGGDFERDAVVIEF